MSESTSLPRVERYLSRGQIAEECRTMYTWMSLKSIGSRGKRRDTARRGRVRGQTRRRRFYHQRLSPPCTCATSRAFVLHGEPSRRAAGSLAISHCKEHGTSSTAKLVLGFKLTVCRRNAPRCSKNSITVWRCAIPSRLNPSDFNIAVRKSRERTGKFGRLPVWSRSTGRTSSTTWTRQASGKLRNPNLLPKGHLFS